MQRLFFFVFGLTVGLSLANLNGLPYGTSCLYVCMYVTDVLWLNGAR